jgi:hypothetical protein
MKVRIIVLILVPVLVLYLLLFPDRLGEEISASLVWVNDISLESNGAVTAGAPDISPDFITEEGQPSELYAFRLGDIFGFIGDDGRFEYVGRAAYGVAFGEDIFINYPNVVSNLAVQDAAGRIRMGIPTYRYPFYLSGRLFLISSDRLSLSELDLGGAGVWDRTFPSLVTAVDGNEAMMVIGMLDGRIEVLDRLGGTVFETIPDGSRIPVVYGCALSPDARYFAVVCGIDPQRLLLYRLDEEADTYSEVLDLPLDGAKRRPVTVAFSEDGTVVFVETAYSIACLDVETHTIVNTFELQGRIDNFIARGRGALSYVITSADGNSVLRVFESGGRRVYEERFAGDVVSLSECKAGILLGVDSDLGLFELAVR